MRNMTAAACAALAFLGAAPSPGLAGEGGGSMYLQGTNGDFFAGMFGPSGFYFRNDLSFYDSRIGARILDDRVTAGIHQQIVLNITKLAWLSDEGILGARYGAAIAIPYVFNAHVTGSLSAEDLDLFASGNVNGLGDIVLNPIILNWAMGASNFTFSPSIIAPTGRYDAERLLNTGRNYWAFDLMGSYTWFDPAIGTDISLTTGFLFNARNPDTNYSTGTEYHLDWLIAQHLSETVALGAAGYYYQQISSDEGKLIGNVDAGEFRGRGAGIGPAIAVTLPMGERPVTFTAKALFDVDSEKRFDGDIYSFSTSFKF
jgi:hypothetical protein